MSKPTKPKPQKKESHKETVAKIAAENRAYLEKQDAKNQICNSTKMYLCPHCYEKCLVPENVMGRDVLCQHCSKIFNATAPTINIQSKTTKTKQAEALVEMRLDVASLESQVRADIEAFYSNKLAHTSYQITTVPLRFRWRFITL